MGCSRCRRPAGRYVPPDLAEPGDGRARQTTVTTDGLTFFSAWLCPRCTQHVHGLLRAALHPYTTDTA